MWTQGNKSDVSGRYFQTKINGNIGNSAVTSSIEEVPLSRPCIAAIGKLALVRSDLCVFVLRCQAIAEGCQCGAAARC